MTQTFACPHCQNEYVVLPTLAGRRVRCTACKNIFKFGYDGIATVEQSAQVAADTQGKDAPSKKPIRSHTKAIKKKTERIQKMRQSLQDAAQAAMANVGRENEAAQVALDKKNAPAERKVVSRAMPVVKPRSNAHVVLMLGVVFVVILLWWFTATATEQGRCLDEFCKRLSGPYLEYPQRLPAYRERFWVPSRDGDAEIPVILNINQAHLAELRHINWIDIVTVCADLIEGMELNPRFAMWHATGAADRVEELWTSFEFKAQRDAFIEHVRTQNIDCVPFSAVPYLLIEAGHSSDVVYVVSVLLAGFDEDRVETQLDFGFRGGVLPSVMSICEFSGQDGHLLTDGGGHYDVLVVQSYSGLLVGFEGAAEQARWAVLDIRLQGAMEPFYDLAHNPLLLRDQRAHLDLLQMTEGAKEEQIMGEAVD